MVRFKNRYSLCQIVTPGGRLPSDVTSSQVYKAVKNAVLDTHGHFGLASLQFSLSVKYLNISTNIIIIRGERRFFQILSSSLIFVKKVGNTDVILKTIHVGGSIRACQKALIRYHRRKMTELFPHCKTEAERSAVLKSIQEACDDMEAGRSTHKPSGSAPQNSSLKMLMSDEFS